MGADVVTRESDAKQEVAAAGLPPPALGLNCVGGSAALAVSKLVRWVGESLATRAWGLLMQ